jgi:hypothetical protein
MLEDGDDHRSTQAPAPIAGGDICCSASFVCGGTGNVIGPAKVWEMQLSAAGRIQWLVILGGLQTKTCQATEADGVSPL